MEIKETIEALNKLIVINNDRIDGYETAAKETEDSDLKIIFEQLGSTSNKCKSELASEVIRLGGTPEEGTRLSGKFFRAWMDVKAALTGKDRKAILNSCEQGEDAATEAYEDALKDDVEYLSEAQQRMIKEHHTWLLADHDKVKSMRDAVIA
jgi:uncharacterized protein (TIGR02284 family)